MKQLILAALLSWPILISVPAHAQGTLYKWTDSRGNIHYTNTPTSINAKAVDDVLPPAANFTSPTKPTVAAKATPQPNPDTKGKPSPEGEPSSTESPDDGSTAPADQEQTEEAPSPVAPQPASTEQQPLTPAQQALKDSPAPMD